MGAVVGVVVGAVDGARVGDIDGAADGARVGAVDGAAVGALDGAADGARVGAAVGALDGALLGAPVGARDGALLGANDGARDGALVGKSVARLALAHPQSIVNHPSWQILLAGSGQHQFSPHPGPLCCSQPGGHTPLTFGTLGEVGPCVGVLLGAVVAMLVGVPVGSSVRYIGSLHSHSLLYLPT